MDEIKTRTLRAIEEKVFPGCVIGYIRDGRSEILPFGHLKYEQSLAVTERTIYDLASITKSIPLASVALTFIAEGKLSLGASVKKYIPELKNDYDATIEDLLRYRVKGPRMSTLPHATFEEIRTAVFETGFDGPPGEESYSNAPAFLLGIVLERVGAMILPALANRYFFEPLNMREATFFPHDIQRVAPTEIIGSGKQRKDVRAIVHDESARLFAVRRRAVGHAGLFSTAGDLLLFLEALLDVRHPMSYTMSYTRAVVDGAQQELGWEVNREWMGNTARQGLAVFGKTGFTGTSVLCDVHRKIGLVILSNRTYPKRPPDNAAINALRKDIADIVLA